MKEELFDGYDILAMVIVVVFMLLILWICL